MLYRSEKSIAYLELALGDFVPLRKSFRGLDLLGAAWVPGFAPFCDNARRSQMSPRAI